MSKPKNKDPNPVLAAWLDSPGLAFQSLPIKEKKEEQAPGVTFRSVAPSPPEPNPAGKIEPNANVTTESMPAASAAPHNPKPSVPAPIPEAMKEAPMNKAVEAGSSLESTPPVSASADAAGNHDAPVQKPVQFKPSQPPPVARDHSHSQMLCVDAAMRHYMDLVQKDNERLKAQEASTSKTSRGAPVISLAFTALRHLLFILALLTPFLHFSRTLYLQAEKPVAAVAAVAVAVAGVVLTLAADVAGTTAMSVQQRLGKAEPGRRQQSVHR